MLRTWLGRQFSPHKRKFTLVKIGMTGLNASIFALLVSAGVNPVVANLSRTAVTTQVSFGIHRHFTWRDQRHIWPFWSQWRRHHIVKVSTTTSKQAVFILLVNFCSTPCWLAYVVSVTGIGAVSYMLSLKFVFGIKETCSAPQS